MTPFGYGASTTLARWLPPPSSKLAKSMRGRSKAAELWASWASIQRTDGPLIWVHGASVGEGLAAAPVVSRLRRELSNLQVVHTFSSPSAAAWPGGFVADQSGYVPIDRPSEVNVALEALNPSLLVFSRGDLWPELVSQASMRATPVAVLGGTVRHSSLRLKWPMRRFMAPVYARVNWLGAASREHAERWVRLGVDPAAVAITGDPRHDMVLERHTRLGVVKPLANWGKDRSVLVAGSTHQKDETVLTDALSRVANSRPEAALVIVPHDPTQEALDRCVSLARSRGLQPELWDASPAAHSTNCIVVGRQGVLADLFIVATIAYVGGGFRHGQLHSVAEPAAYAIPIVFGPEFSSSLDAPEILARGGAIALERRSPAARLAEVWKTWIENSWRATACGLRARAALQQGASATTVRELRRLLNT